MWIRGVAGQVVVADREEGVEGGRHRYAQKVSRRGWTTAGGGPDFCFNGDLIEAFKNFRTGEVVAGEAEPR